VKAFVFCERKSRQPHFIGAFKFNLNKKTLAAEQTNRKNNKIRKMVKWIVLSLVALAIVGSLWAKPLDSFDTINVDLIPVNAPQHDLQESFGDDADAAAVLNEPASLSRKKRQYYYYNSIYNPYEYNKKRNPNKYPNRRGFRSTTQRYTIWDLARK